MIEKILNDKAFISTMQKHCYAVINRLLELKIEFCIVANTKFVEYAPALPEDLNPNKNPFALFALAGYTFESVQLQQDKISFHAGFGPTDFATFVSVDLGAITQIQVENDIIFVNFSFYSRVDEKNLTQNSMNIFLNNPQNKDSLKK